MKRNNAGSGIADAESEGDLYGKKVKKQRHWKWLGCGHRMKFFPGCNEDLNCQALVKKLYDCGHQKKFPCYQAMNNTNCGIMKTVNLNCGHVACVKCEEKESEIKCEVLIKLKLEECGHHSTFSCWEITSGKVRCQRRRVLTKLECGHKRKARCGAKKVRCLKIIKTLKFDCGHDRKVKCFEISHKKNINVTLICREKCATRLECGHIVSLECHQVQDPKSINCVCCEEAGTDLQPQCSHRRGSLVDFMDDIACTESCGKKLNCGHYCSRSCHVSEPKKHNFKCKMECTRRCQHGNRCPFIHECRYPCKVAFDKLKNLDKNKKIMTKFPNCPFCIKTVLGIKEKANVYR